MIKNLELQSFKSFSRRISIPLSKGITAIVGPNGSGKSNIVDAFCFVLGRRSAKSMRADRLPQLIYNGGKKNQPSPFLEVSISLENTDRKLPVDADEVAITRRLTKNGTMTYKINNEKCTRAQLVDVLSLSNLDPEGHNIILQGNITEFIDMDPDQRRGIIDEVSGIAEYDAKKQDALKDLSKVEENIKEIVIMLSERKKRIKGLSDEKEGAEKYKLYKAELSKLEANLAHSKLAKLEKESSKITEELAAKSEDEQKALGELKELANSILKKEKEFGDLNKRLIREGGDEQLSIRSEIEGLKSRIQIANSKIESKKAEISSIDAMISRLQSIADESDEGSKVSILRDNIKGIHGTVDSLYSVEEKYASALDSAIGSRGKFIVVDNEDVALECIEFLKRGQLGRATFLPLTLIKGQRLETAKEKGAIGLAIEHIKFNSKYQKIFEHILTSTLIVETLSQTKYLLGRHRLVSLDGDLADKSGAITGGFKKRIAQKQARSPAEEYTEKRDALLDEIEALKQELEDLNRKLQESQQKETKFGSTYLEMQTATGLIERELDEMRSQKDNISAEHDDKLRKVGDLRIVKAQVDSKLDDHKINMKRFSQAEFSEVDVADAEKQVDGYMRKILELEPVNMKAIEEYDLEVKSYKEFEEKFIKLQEERKSILSFIDEIESRKKEVFFGVFNKVAEEFSKIFPKLSPNGEAKLVLENPDDPFAAGMLVEARPAGKKLQSLELLSGGEKVLTALSFLFALQRYRPAPIYILDEVDAALDQYNSLRFVELLRENIGDGQMLLISHNPAVVKKVDRLFGISMSADNTSRLVGMDLGEFQGAE